MNKIKKFFLYSETIFLARLTMFIGALLTAAVQVDPAIFQGLSGKWFPIFLVFHGALAEILRKHRDEPLKERGR